MGQIFYQYWSPCNTCKTGVLVVMILPRRLIWSKTDVVAVRLYRKTEVKIINSLLQNYCLRKMCCYLFFLLNRNWNEWTKRSSLRHDDFKNRVKGIHGKSLDNFNQAEMIPFPLRPSNTSRSALYMYSLHIL